MIAAALLNGFAAIGETARLFNAGERGVLAPVAVFYGFDPDLRRVFAEYRRAGCTVVTVDLGFWARKEGGARAGYHKVSVNGRHPTAYFQTRKHDASRIEALGVAVRPWRQGGKTILVAGMSAKSAGVEGFTPEQWERQAIAVLKRHTDRPIVYRPKPSWRDAMPIEGARFEPHLDGLEGLLGDCHAVVTHHSNVGVDALAAGVPVFSVEGVATRLGLADLALIDKPRRDDGREQFMADLAWCQWTPREMASGTCWRHLKDEGLV